MCLGGVRTKTYFLDSRSFLSFEDGERPLCLEVVYSMGGTDLSCLGEVLFNTGRKKELVIFISKSVLKSVSKPGLTPVLKTVSKLGPMSVPKFVSTLGLMNVPIPGPMPGPQTVPKKVPKKVPIIVPMLVLMNVPSQSPKPVPMIALYLELHLFNIRCMDLYKLLSTTTDQE